MFETKFKLHPDMTLQGTPLQEWTGLRTKAALMFVSYEVWVLQVLVSWGLQMLTID